MISELRITDLGVIKEATMALHPGLTVVTGETGAGKTMVVTGLSLLLGNRADPKAVRTGAQRAIVEGRFSAFDPALLAQVHDVGGELDDGELLIARHLTAAGRSRAFVGGAQVPSGICGGIAEQLVTIHGQSEQIRLSTPERQREILDRSAGPALAAVLADYQIAYAEHRRVVSRLETLRSEAASRAREVDLLQFGLTEIDRVAPEPGEDVALTAEAQRLQSADDLRLLAQNAMVALAGSDDEQGGALTSLAVGRSGLDRLAQADRTAAELASRIAEVSYLVVDLAGDLARYLDGLEAQPGRLEGIAERRSALSGLTRKYGLTCDAVLEWSATASERLADLQASEEGVSGLESRAEQLDAELSSLTRRITSMREQAAVGFGARVLTELAALAMPHAQLEFHVRPADRGPHGSDSVDLLFSANPGSDPRSIAKVASGGELSRVRLALEVVLAEGRQIGTFVFDEVDAGVGGRVAVEIGRRLADLARHAQVVVVTHLAQVAAFADRHYLVVKSDDGQVSTSGLVQVADEHRAAELARMMAGLETSESALAHAGELVELASVARAELG